MIQKKICMLGSFSVGKTSLIRQYVRSIFLDKYLSTVGVKIDKKEISVNGQDLTLMIWDLAGKDDFTGLKKSYLRGAAGCILVVDGCRAKTAEIALRQYEFLRKEFPSVEITVALNKSDLESEWEIDVAAFQDCFPPGFTVHKTSAKSESTVEALFLSLATKLLDTKPKAA